MVQQADHLHHVVIVGGGFGGLNAARELGGRPVHVTLIDKRNFHLFQPLLYQVATGSLSPANIAAPLRWVLRRQRNVEVILGEVVGFDVASRKVILSDGEVSYDSLIVAAGSRYNYFGHDEWESRAPGLKTIEDATEIRRRVLLAFEAAERENDAGRRAEWLTFVIVGAGPTGVEMAGALAEVARHTLRQDFRHINPAEATILLVEGGNQVLSAYPTELSSKALEYLQRLGVTVVTRSVVSEVHADYIRVNRGTEVETIRTRTIIWAAGVRANPLGPLLATSAGAEMDRIGRVIVGPDLSIPGHPEIFVIGDLAHFVHEGKPLPGVAPAAIQQGKHAARVLLDRLEGRSSPPFRYRDYGNMATIGRAAAVAEIRGWKFKGFIAWLLWLFVHLMQLVNFQNRVLVLVQWAWNYITFNRSSRLITGPVMPVEQNEPTTARPELLAAMREREREAG